MPPPSDIKEVNILEWLNEFLKKFNEINLNEKKQKTFIDDEIRSKKILLIFKKNQKIHFNTVKNKESNFIYSLDNNSFILKRPIYLTSENNEIIININFKKNEWFKLKLFGVGSNIENNYNFKTELNKTKNQNKIYLTSALKIKKKLTNVIMIKHKREVVKLGPNMIFIDDNNKKVIPINLNKKILYIPEETVITANINITGNIINTEKTDSGIDITVLKDIFIYINKKMINVSFNKEKWDLTLSSIDFKPKLTIKSIDDKKIDLNLDIKLLHKE
jgi:hypothetical protein